MNEPQRPVARRDGKGRLHVDLRALLAIAAPLMVTNAIQALLNLTDTWFIGRLSTDAVAAMGSIYWLMTCAILVLGGVGLATQSFVSQADGAGRRARASQCLWNSIWGTFLALPLFAVATLSGASILAFFDLDPAIRMLAVEYCSRGLRGLFSAASVGRWSVFSTASVRRVSP